MTSDNWKQIQFIFWTESSVVTYYQRLSMILTHHKFRNLKQIATFVSENRNLQNHVPLTLSCNKLQNTTYAISCHIGMDTVSGGWLFFSYKIIIKVPP